MSDKHKKLEEDIAACPYPVFGLQESVYDLEYVDHYEEEGRFTICYQSRSRDLCTISITSSIYMHEGPMTVVHDTTGYSFPRALPETALPEDQEEEVIITQKVVWNEDQTLEPLKLNPNSAKWDENQVQTPPYGEDQPLELPMDLAEKEEIRTLSFAGFVVNQYIDDFLFVGEACAMLWDPGTVRWCCSSPLHHYHIDGRADGLTLNEVIHILDKLKILK
jgi:hypothetical protein